MFKLALGTISEGGRALSLLGGALAIYAAFFAAPGTAQAQPGKLTELLRLDGSSASYDSDTVRFSMKQAFRQQAFNDPQLGNNDKFLSAADAAIDKVLAPATLKATHLEAMRGKLTAGEIDTLIDFFKAPLGKRLTAMELSAQAVDQAVIDAQTLELMEALKSDPERADTFRRLEKSMHVTDRGVDAALYGVQIISIGLAAGHEKTLSPEEVDRTITYVRPRLAAQVQEFERSLIAYTYKEASIAELNEYIEFTSTPLGQKYVNASLKAISAAISKAVSQFGDALAKELDKNSV